MTSSHPSTFLRRALVLDACLSGASALLLLLGAEVLARPLGFSAAFLRGVGIVLVPFTALLVYLLFRKQLSAAAARFVIVCNVLWAVDSILLLFSGWVDPTLFGESFVVTQAVVVAAFAEMQYVGLRRLAPRPA